MSARNRRRHPWLTLDFPTGGFRRDPYFDLECWRANKDPELVADQEYNPPLLMHEGPKPRAGLPSWLLRRRYWLTRIFGRCPDIFPPNDIIPRNNVCYTFDRLGFNGLWNVVFDGPGPGVVARRQGNTVIFDVPVPRGLALQDQVIFDGPGSSGSAPRNETNLEGRPGPDGSLERKNNDIFDGPGPSGLRRPEGAPSRKSVIVDLTNERDTSEVEISDSEDLTDSD